MTVIAALHVPGQGSVIASDSRATTNTAIFSDARRKIVVGGEVACAVAGVAGRLTDLLADVSSWSDVVSLANDYGPTDWSLLCASPRGVHYIDGGGTAHTFKYVHAIGSGSEFALGFIDAHAKPKTLKDAAELVSAAVKCAIKRDAGCGGKTYVVLIAKTGHTIA